MFVTKPPGENQCGQQWVCVTVNVRVWARLRACRQGQQVIKGSASSEQNPPQEQAGEKHRPSEATTTASRIPMGKLTLRQPTPAQAETRDPLNGGESRADTMDALRPYLQTPSPRAAPKKTSFTARLPGGAQQVYQGQTRQVTKGQTKPFTKG